MSEREGEEEEEDEKEKDYREIVVDLIGRCIGNLIDII